MERNLAGLRSDVSRLVVRYYWMILDITDGKGKNLVCGEFCG
jgi:hypothetical protein